MPFVFNISDQEFRDSILKTPYAIIPIGSLEQHGEHLPVSTDSLIAEHIAGLVAEHIPSFVFPIIPYGVSYEHRPMFNMSIRNSTLSHLICDICMSLAENGIKKIILLNGHHGNVGVLQYIAQEVNGKIPKNVNIFSINYWHLMENEFDHAGNSETSLVLAIDPRLVRMNKAKPNSRTLSKSKAAYSAITNLPGSFPKMTGNGVWGDPRNASVDNGKKMINEIVNNLIQTILELKDL